MSNSHVVLRPTELCKMEIGKKNEIHSLINQEPTVLVRFVGSDGSTGFPVGGGGFISMYIPQSTLDSDEPFCWEGYICRYVREGGEYFLEVLEWADDDFAVLEVKERREIVRAERPFSDTKLEYVMKEPRESEEVLRVFLEPNPHSHLRNLPRFGFCRYKRDDDGQEFIEILREKESEHARLCS